jgi:hypothetical protein
MANMRVPLITTVHSTPGDESWALDVSPRALCSHQGPSQCGLDDINPIDRAELVGVATEVFMKLVFLHCL